MKDYHKMRAWDENRKQFLYFDWDDYHSGCSWWRFTYPKKPELGVCVEVEDGLEQIKKELCTGLKDKNDRLIYEGDILRDKRRSAYGIRITKVIFCAGIWRLDTYNSSTKSFEYAMFLHKHPYDFKIIGNIHENPELLESE